MSIEEDAFFLADGTDIRDLPKVSLHDHLDGGLRPSTLIELADDLDFELPESEPEALAEWFVENADSGSLVNYLRTFAITTEVMQTRQGLRRIARDYVNDLAADGVVYGEVRWAPEQHLTRGLSLDAAVEAVQDGIVEGIDDVRERGGRIRVNQILCAMRQNKRSRAVADLCLRWRHDGVVGFDLAGPEKGFPPSDHQDALDHLADNFFPITLHAGEAGGLDSIRAALLDGYALRLGHGIGIAHDIDIRKTDDDAMYVALGPMAEWVKNRQIALEVCPTSNLQTREVEAWSGSLERHPFDLLYQLGFNVTVSCDNRLMGGVTLSEELAALAETFGYDWSDLEVLQLNAAEASFLPVDEREQLAELIAEGFDRARP